MADILSRGYELIHVIKRGSSRQYISSVSILPPLPPIFSNSLFENIGGKGGNRAVLVVKLHFTLAPRLSNASV